MPHLKVDYSFFLYRKTTGPATEGLRVFRFGSQSKDGGVLKGEKCQERNELSHCKWVEWGVREERGSGQEKTWDKGKEREGLNNQCSTPSSHVSV